MTKEEIAELMREELRKVVEEEMREFLRNNLKVEVTTNFLDNFGPDKSQFVAVELILEYKVISTSKDIVCL